MWAKEEQDVQNQSRSELILDVSEHNKNILRHPRSSELWFQEYYTTFATKGPIFLITIQKTHEILKILGHDSSKHLARWQN
jgi:hypothetical protein